MNASLMDEVLKIRDKRSEGNAPSLKPEEFIEKSCNSGDVECIKHLLKWSKETYFLDRDLTQRKRNFLIKVMKILNRKIT